MCDPVTAGALALSAGGTFLESREQSKNMKRQQRAKEAAFRRGLDKQDAFANTARERFQPLVKGQGAQAFDADLTNAVTKRLQAFNDNAVATPDEFVGPASTPKNVVIARNKAFAESDDETERDNTALAKLGGYGSTIFDQNLNRNQYARDFSNLVSEASGQSRLLPLEMNAAYNNAAKKPSMLPKLMKLGGQAASLYSAAGAPGWADTVAARPNAAFVGPMPMQPGYGTKISNAFGGFF